MGPQNKSFIRFEGRLWENLAYEPKIGWETANIAHRPEAGDGAYMIDLIGEN